MNVTVARAPSRGGGKPGATSTRVGQGVRGSRIIRGTAVNG